VRERGDVRQRQRRHAEAGQRVQPQNTKKPIPDASSPGSSTIPRVAPPSPADSINKINKKAPRMGEPNRALIAAKLPLAATIA
jgi:hypothetical protein